MPIIALADLKTWLGISDSLTDAQITTAVAAANSAVVAYCGRSFDKIAIGAETTRTYRTTDRHVAEVDDFYDVTNLIVVSDDSDAGTFATTWAKDVDFECEPLNGLDGPFSVPFWRLRAINNNRWPTRNRRASLRVTAAWGWSSVPSDVFTAALIKAARTYKRKDSPEGVLGGIGDVGVVRVTNREDPDVCSLLRPYRRVSATALIG